MRELFQPQADLDGVGQVVAREAPPTSNRILMFVVVPEAGGGVERTANPAKAQGLDHEALDDLCVAGFLEAGTLLAEPHLAKQERRQAYTALGQFVKELCEDDVHRITLYDGWCRPSFLAEFAG